MYPLIAIQQTNFEQERDRLIHRATKLQLALDRVERAILTKSYYDPRIVTAHCGDRHV